MESLLVRVKKDLLESSSIKREEGNLLLVYRDEVIGDYWWKDKKNGVRVRVRKDECEEITNKMPNVGECGWLCKGMFMDFEGRERVWIWKPQLDLTLQELSILIPFLISFNDITVIMDLEKELGILRRHFIIADVEKIKEILDIS